MDGFIGGGLSILGKDVAERRLATAELLWGNVRLKTKTPIGTNINHMIVV